MTVATTLASSPNEDLWNSSVHCSYYSLLQMMIHLLTDVKHKPVNIADLTKNSNSHIVIRDAVATEIGSSSERLSFLTGFDYLKRMRVHADYTTQQFSQPECLDIRDKAQSLRNRVNSYLK
ncbi:MAG: hypothetical protein K2L28_04875 [Muribaculaceae bacterium]|nr:hypothetical protein [Muribaculaceae bacterium]